jgi:hypothetical protein
MAKYLGACHCSAVSFTVNADVTELRKCNCSLCSKKGAQTIRVRGDELQIIKGAENLTEYKFNTHTARHFFCKVCGIYTFHRPRTAPEDWGVNAGCLEGLDMDSLPLRKIDGRTFSVAEQ